MLSNLTSDGWSKTHPRLKSVSPVSLEKVFKLPTWSYVFGPKCWGNMGNMLGKNGENGRENVLGKVFGLVGVCFSLRCRFCYLFFGGWIELGEAFVTVLPEHKEKFKEAPKRERLHHRLYKGSSQFLLGKSWELPLWRGFCDFVWWQAWPPKTWTFGYNWTLFVTTEKCLFLASRIYLFLGYGANFSNKSVLLWQHMHFFDLQGVSKMMARIDLNGFVGHQWHHVSRLQRYRQGPRWGGGWGSCRKRAICSCNVALVNMWHTCIFSKFRSFI